MECKQTYQMASDPPPALSWDEYKPIVLEQWEEVLNAPDQSDESIYQRFLERHPCLLPESYATFRQGAHGAYFSAVISQPELPGERRKVPDFMIITRDSARVLAILIEIEAPSKRWFTTTSGQPTAEWTQARNQLDAWRAWFMRPENVLTFQNTYRLDAYMRGRSFEQRYVLIYGRRRDAQSNEAAAQMRAGREKHDERILTYDRLAPNEHLRNYPTVRLDRTELNSQLRLMHVPATLRFGPMVAPDFAELQGWKEAIEQNELMPAARKSFLVQRLEYWNAWVREQPRGIVHPRDWE